MLCFMRNKLLLCNNIIKSFWYFCSCLNWEWPETIGGWARLSSPMVADQKRTMASSAISSQTRPDMIEIPINQNWMRRNTLGQSGQIWMTKSGKYCTPLYDSAPQTRGIPINQNSRQTRIRRASEPIPTVTSGLLQSKTPNMMMKMFCFLQNTMFNSYKYLTCITETMFDLNILYYPLDLLE